TERAITALAFAGHWSVTGHLSPVRFAISSVRITGAIFSAAGKSPPRITIVAPLRSSGVAATTWAAFAQHNINAKQAPKRMGPLPLCPDVFEKLISAATEFRGQ